MSTFNELDITCGECGEEFEGTVWTAIHAGEDPELKELLLGGELNIAICPKCSHAAYQDHFVLYQDPPAELVAYIYPPARQPEEAFLRNTMKENFEEAQKVFGPDERKDYEPLLLFGLDTLIELMKEEELRAAQSQIAEALCKENRISYVKLRPNEARKRKLMRVLPVASTHRPTDRDNLLEGLQKALTINPALDLYAQFQENLKSDVSFVIPAQAGIQNINRTGPPLPRG